MLCSGKGGVVRGAQGTSQQPKWAKPRTASSLGLLSHSCLGLALGTALDLSLWICAITPKVGSTTRARPVWDALARRLQKRDENKEHSADVCIYEQTSLSCLHVRAIYCGLSSYWSTTKPNKPVCICRGDDQNGPEVRTGAISQWHLFNFSTPVWAALRINLGSHAVNNWACFVTVILSADTLITAQVMKERDPLICHALCAGPRPSKTDRAVSRTQYHPSCRLWLIGVMARQWLAAMHMRT